MTTTEQPRITRTVDNIERRRALQEPDGSDRQAERTTTEHLWCPVPYCGTTVADPGVECGKPDCQPQGGLTR